jgi:hypothetical protein
MGATMCPTSGRSIRIWQSFSCNNSSNYRLVARFGEPAAAAETERELRAVLAEHAAEAKASTNRNDESFAIALLAETYGLADDELAMRGVGTLEDVEVSALGEVLVVYHDYCLGFGDGFRAYLKARGALRINENAANPPQLSVLFAHPGSAALDLQLDALIAQNTDSGKTAFVTPWGTAPRRGRLFAFRDAGTVGIHFQLTPHEIPAVRAWLDEHGVTASLQWCETDDWHLFRKVAQARCTACSGMLQYLDPRIHDIEKPQLVCAPCGGLYDLEAFEDPPAGATVPAR